MNDDDGFTPINPSHGIGERKRIAGLEEVLKQAFLDGYSLGFDECNLGSGLIGFSDARRRDYEEWRLKWEKQN